MQLINFIIIIASMFAIHICSALANDTSISAKNEFSCNIQKTKCSQMRSCAEAKFYYHTCGVARLDRDNDGIPCEKICGHH